MTDKKQKILESVIEILICILDIKREKITLESSFVDDLGADSLDSVEIIMEIEKKI